MKSRSYSLQSLAVLAIIFIALLLTVGNTGKGTAKVASANGWMTQVGAGLFAPACGSSGISSTCSNGRPVVTFSWANDTLGSDCFAWANSGANYAGMNILVNGASVYRAPGGIGPNRVTSSYTWTGGSPNRTYTYELSCYLTWDPSQTDSFRSGTFTMPAFCPSGISCQDPLANNFGGALPCTYSSTGGPTSCRDPLANNFGGALPCAYGNIGNIGNIGGPTSCLLYNFCSGNDVYRKNATCTNSFVRTCPYGCESGACLPPPAVTINSRLRVAPSILRPGETTKISWDVSNAESCTVTGTNGNVFTGLSSAESSCIKDLTVPTSCISSPIWGQTTYTLFCRALDDATPPTYTDTAAVNLLPVINEE